MKTSLLVVGVFLELSEAIVGGTSWIDQVTVQRTVNLVGEV